MPAPMIVCEGRLGYVSTRIIPRLWHALAVKKKLKNRRVSMRKNVVQSTKIFGENETSEGSHVDFQL